MEVIGEDVRHGLGRCVIDEGIINSLVIHGKASRDVLANLREVVGKRLSAKVGGSGAGRLFHSAYPGDGLFGGRIVQGARFSEAVLDLLFCGGEGVGLIEYFDEPLVAAGRLRGLFGSLVMAGKVDREVPSAIAFELKLPVGVMEGHASRDRAVSILAECDGANLLAVIRAAWRLQVDGNGVAGRFGRFKVLAQAELCIITIVDLLGCIGDASCRRRPNHRIFDNGEAEGDFHIKGLFGVHGVSDRLTVLRDHTL